MTDFPPEAATVLTAVARTAIARHIGEEVPAVPEGIEWLDRDGASFVTLTLDVRLRGCIGSLQAHRSLADDVAANAVSAAFRDPRFAPMDPTEVAASHIEVSVLTTPEELEFDSESGAIEKLRPNVDGVILQVGSAKATFLPQVWQQLEHPVEFLQHLKRKAGIRATYWGPDVRLWTYQVHAFDE